jgi:hypothetical protein
MVHHAPCGGSGYCPQRQYLERKKDSRRTNLLKQYNKWEKRKWEIKELANYLVVLEKRNIFAHDIK